LFLFFLFTKKKEKRPDIKPPVILMALGKIQHLYNILYIADACVLGKQLWLSILCHLD
jgi:hypothetical protein